MGLLLFAGGGAGARDDFAIKSTGQFVLLEGGNFWFVCNSDDGFSLIIDGHQIGPHGQWKFDQIQNLNVTDTGGSHFDGTLSSSGASPIQGMRGQGLYLDGIQGSVTIPPLNLVNHSLGSFASFVAQEGILRCLN